MRNIFVIFLFLIILMTSVRAELVTGSGTGGGGGGGSVSITSSTNNIVVSPSPLTGTGTVGATDVINAQGTTTPYTIQASDMGKTVTHNKATAVAVTLPQAGTAGFGAGLSYSEINLGAGAVTITPTTSTINGASTLVLGAGNVTSQSAYIISDGTNYVAFLGNGGSPINLGASVSATNPRISGDATTGLYTNGAAQVDVAISGSNALHINSTGVGIGTTMPLTALDVNGAVNLSGTISGVPAEPYAGIYRPNGSTVETFLNAGGDAIIAAYDQCQGGSGNFVSLLVENGCNASRAYIEMYDFTGGDNQNFGIYTEGTGSLFINSQSGSNPIAKFVDTASSVDWVQINGAATANPANVGIAALGSDTNIGLNLTPKGSGGITVTSTSANAIAVGTSGITTPIFTVDASTASAVAGLNVKGAVTGGTVTVGASDSGSNTNLTVQSKGTGTFVLAVPGTGSMNLSVNAANRETLTASNITLAPGASGSASQTALIFNAPASSGVTASTEQLFGNFNAVVAHQHATGSLTLQRDFIFQGANNAFVGASALTDGATLGIVLPGCSTNATCTNLDGIYHASTALTVTGTTTNSYIINVSSDTGASNNYAARLNGLVQMPALATASSSETSAVCLDGSGNVIADSVTCISSSARFKDVNNHSVGGLTQIMALKPVSFKYKKSYLGPHYVKDPNHNGEQIGFIAEQVEKVDPRYVLWEKDGKTPHSVRYDQMVALLTSAIQQQQHQIDELRNELEKRRH